MPVLRNTVQFPDGTPAAGTVTVKLIAGSPGVGFDAAEEVTIAHGRTIPFAGGEWEMELARNADLDPVGTYWYVVEEVTGGGRVEYTIDIPASGDGPFWVRDRLTSIGEAPASVSTPVATAATNAITAQVTGDSVARFAVRGDGRIEWGDGAVTRDTNLYRDSASLLRSDDDFRARSLIVDGTVRAAFLKTTSTSEHAATVYQAATSGTGAALNVVSDNPSDSAMYLSGKETGRGTLKIAHIGQADGSDGAGSAISIDLQTAGTAARGIFITSTTGTTSGDLIVARNNSRDDFVVKSTGRMGIALPTATTPDARLDVRQGDDSTPGVSVRANSTSAGNLLELRRSSDGAVRTRVDAQCQLVTQQSAFFAGPVTQIGGTSGTAGGGSGVLGVTNATTVPTTNPTGGGVLYAEGGQLKWRDPNGDVTTFTASPVIPGDLQVSGQTGLNTTPDANIPLLVAAPNDQPGVQVTSADTSNTRALVESRGPDTSTTAYGTRVTGDSNDRFGIDTDGFLSWGSGSGSRDTNLYRSAADTLRTGDNFTVDQALTVSGNAAVTGNLTVSGVGQTLDAYKTADESVTSSTAMQDDNHLVVNVVNGAVYIVECFLLYTAATAGDIKVALIAGTGTPTFQHSCMAMDTSTAAVVNSVDMGSGPYGTEHARGSASTTTPQVILMKGTLEANATTTFRLRWAQNSSNGTATTILRGSYLTARRIA